MADTPFSFQKTILPHLLALLAFLVVTFIYFSPILEGKTLAQHDSIQAKAAAREINEYHQKTGDWAFWTQTMFSGMPTYLIGGYYPGSWTTRLGQLITSLLPEPANLVVMYLLGFYVLMLAMGCNAWLSTLGAFAFAFCSYNLINIEAGHVSKAIAIAYVPPMIAGVWLAFRGKYLLGGSFFGLFLALNLYGNHVQITYYTFIMLGIFGIFQLVFAIRKKTFKNFGLAAAALALGGLLGAGSHASRLLTTQEYSKFSIRGKSELTPPDTAATSHSTEGLDKDYAFQWSYGVGETFTLLVPGFQGSGQLGNGSEVAKVLKTGGIPKNQMKQTLKQISGAMYWGEQPGTGGPAYAGAIVCFLFVLGMFVVKNPLKWWLFATSVFFIMLSWGKNFESFNYLMFDAFPLYNKFRAITMVLTVLQIPLCMLAVMALQEITTAKYAWKDFQRPLFISLGITAGICLILAVMGGNLFDFNSAYDAQLGNENLTTAIHQDRAGLLQGDALRSLFFILATAGLLTGFVLNRVPVMFLIGGLTVLVIADMTLVDSRYFNKEDFVSKKQYEQQIAPSPADELVLKDTAQSYRVFDGTTNAFSDAKTSLFHKSVGGYHGAKMRRYQELVENVISPQLQVLYDSLKKGFSPTAFQSVPALNMLNTKYFIFGQQPQEVLPNALACGNVWFVEKIQAVKNANAEIKALKDNAFNPKNVAVVDERFKSQLTQNPASDSTATIRLTVYKPNEMTYESRSASPQTAVFSEIYYADGVGWEAFVDDKPTPHFRADYVLRAMAVPAGKHKIVFRFNPKTYRQGETVSLICSILLTLMLGTTAFLIYRGSKKVNQDFS
jgi:hypothetical protein